ncbi:hypothetical protein Sme01_17970 [Sphaerisporangium melleum]|uniref:Pyrrolo-quinoline quinone repeat domain-containing protein n=1 Tax=Sphaerisporangium melleum TaxID=321316 RepID=A0A917R2A3_9ACTN|nr:PQQ-binding-like beta-propeller repeat protein [Sphaerisporangium melleum]GGK83858.1 hypothetical protein GCM10007964_27910 [Sphaerisporangium melleum]GII69321.1 hypothetical protein Sme01_17970 [Sphaerisporangium melleum]
MLTRRDRARRPRAWARAAFAVVLITCALPAGAVPGTVRTGEARTRWQARYPAGTYGDAALAGGDVLVVTGALLAAVDAASGRERWRRPMPDGRVLDWLVPAGRVVLATSRATPTGDASVLRAASSADGREVWRRDGLSRAGVWRAPYAGEEVRVIPAWAAGDRLVTGVDPGTGDIRWTWRPPAGCGTPVMSASAGETVVVAIGCGTGVALVALDPAAGRVRWRADVRSVQDIRLLPAAVAVTGGEGLVLLDAGTGRQVTRISECAPDCAPPRASGGRILLAYPAGDAEVLSAVGTTPRAAATAGPGPGTGAETLWRLVERAEPGREAARHSGFVVDATPGGLALGLLYDGTAPGWAADLIDPVRGVLGRWILPVRYRPFGMRGRTVFAVEVAGGPGMARSLNLAAVDLPLDGPPVTAPAPDPCDLLAGTPGLRAVPPVPPFSEVARLTCDFVDARGMRLTVGVWSAPGPQSAADLWRQARDTSEGHGLDAAGDEAFGSGPRDGMIVARRGRHIVWVSSPYLPLHDRLTGLMAEAVARLYRVPQTVRPLAAPSPGPVPAEGGAPVLTLPGTAVTLRTADDARLTLAGYRLRGGTYLRDRSGHLAPWAGAAVTVSPDGRWAVRIGDGAWLDIADRATGRIRRVKAMPGLYGPSWSPSGALVLTRRDEARFVLVDPHAGRVRPVWTDDVGSDTLESPFHWDAGGRTVSASYTSIGESAIQGLLRSFDLGGRRVGELSGVGDTGTGVDDWLSPGRTRFLARCERRPQDLCVHDAATGRLLARPEPGGGRVVAWYDEEHLVVWRREMTGSRALVIDLYGEPVRTLATTDAADVTLEPLWTHS